MDKCFLSHLKSLFYSSFTFWDKFDWILCDMCEVYIAFIDIKNDLRFWLIIQIINQGCIVLKDLCHILVYTEHIGSVGRA